MARPIEVVRRFALGIACSLLLALALNTATLRAETCCTQCSCINLCCSDDACSQPLGAVCGEDFCRYACEDNGGMLIQYNCSDYCG